ncbi:NmrA family NAD(P)-binding protein [Sodalis ligni]|uniref:NmrA family NAD(P)-binding protein n=1 Tax=Sodalis TaxID=84565 RepID=UPI00193F5227|nr:NmrA family NAD(P)-binding protein [Sodalis ligni]QWA10779.1 NmrA family NAD(P)-binding protein [Sodalis ligni]
MYVITGITGKVGGATARKLLSEHQPVRAVMRDIGKAAYWRAQGCEIAIADMDNAPQLTEAFKGATGVFILPPPEFDPAPGFPEARKVIAAVSSAIKAAMPEKAVCLSTIGAQAVQTNLLTQRTLMEKELAALSVPVTFLRPGWFMENAALDIDAARDRGVIQSYLQPLDKAVPMIATADIGRVAAMVLQQSWSGRRVVELEGPRRVSPNDIAKAFADILGRPIVAKAVPRASWESLFRAQGAQNPLPRIQMLDGFNDEWITFEGKTTDRFFGEVELDTVLRGMLLEDA